jgi:hypothetical protein
VACYQGNCFHHHLAVLKSNRLQEPIAAEISCKVRSR